MTHLPHGRPEYTGTCCAGQCEDRASVRGNAEREGERELVVLKINFYKCNRVYTYLNRSTDKANNWPLNIVFHLTLLLTTYNKKKPAMKT